MTTLFASAANKAERDRKREREKELAGKPQENVLERIIRERRAEEIAKAEKAEAWANEIIYALDATGDLCSVLGCPVETIRFENGIIWIRRPGEAIRMQFGEIRDRYDLRAACKKMLCSVCKC